MRDLCNVRNWRKLLSSSAGATHGNMVYNRGPGFAVKDYPGGGVGKLGLRQVHSESLSPTASIDAGLSYLPTGNIVFDRR